MTVVLAALLLSIRAEDSPCPSHDTPDQQVEALAKEMGVDTIGIHVQGDAASSDLACAELATAYEKKASKDNWRAIKEARCPLFTATCAQKLHEVNKLVQKGQNKGAERAYQEVLGFECEIPVADLDEAASVARALGDGAEYRSRLAQAAAKSQTEYEACARARGANEPDCVTMLAKLEERKGAMAQFLAEHGRVGKLEGGKKACKAAKAAGATLEVGGSQIPAPLQLDGGLPFDPGDRAQIERANAIFCETGSYSGFLPTGAYSIAGGGTITVAPAK